MHITCAEVLRELSNYMDDDVTPALRSRIDAHVRACAGCRALYDGVRKVITLVSHNDVIELPEGFSQRLRQRILSRSIAN
jgi:predicted anti-sigma-YlaC factor YlaD